MKKQKRKVILIVLIILIVCIFLFQIRKNPNNKFQDELIFFKLFSSGQEVSTNTLYSKNQIKQPNQQYFFQVSYKNLDFKEVYLYDTINEKTLIREKIAPRNEREV